MRLRKCFLLCLIIAFAFLNAAAEDRQKEFKCYFFDPVEWGQGQSLTLQVIGKKLGPVQSVEVLPAEGLTIGSPKETALTPAEAQRERFGWDIPITVGKDATLGERTVRVTTAEGGIEKKISVVPHAPVISDLKIKSNSSNMFASHVEFELAVLAEASGLPPKMEALVGVERGGFALIKLGLVWFKVKLKDVAPIDGGGKLVKGSFSGDGQAIGPFWDFQVFVRDKDKHSSNTLRTMVTW